MIRQPEYGSRNVTDAFYEDEQKQIQKINKILDGVNLTKSEEKTLLWIAGWEESVVDNLLSVMNKVAEARTGKKEYAAKHHQGRER